MKTLRVYITGTVQGMIYRNYLLDAGLRIGVRGFVRNMEDGRVEVLIEGRDDKVKEMLEVCKKDTNQTKIRGVEVKEIGNQSFEGFKILKI